MYSDSREHSRLYLTCQSKYLTQNKQQNNYNTFYFSVALENTKNGYTKALFEF